MSGLAFLVVGAAAGLSLLMAFGWGVQRRTGQSGWIDVTWTFSLGLAGVFLALWPIGPEGGEPARQFLVAALVAAWSLRLGTHVALRTAKGGDDPRYARLKQDWGEKAQVRMFWFLQVQALAALLMALGVLAAARAPRPELDWRDGLGALILVVGIVGEAMSDSQLKRFSRDPATKGRICDVGLWRFSRHPNYFFEWLGWIAYPVIAVDVAGGNLWGWLALIGPAYMYYLLVRVSGIPPLEEHMMRTRPEAFDAYKARTNAFFPGPPKAAGGESR